MKKQLLFSIFTFLFFSCQSSFEKKEKIKEISHRRVYLKAYNSILLKANDLIIDSVFENRNYSNYESLELDSSSNSILNIKYKSSIRDTLNEFFEISNSLISFEKTPEAASTTLSFWKSGFKLGFDSSA